MKVMAFVMAFYIIMTTPRFPVMLKQLVGFTDSDVSLRLKTVADQAATSSITVSLVPLRIRRSTVEEILECSIKLVKVLFIRPAAEAIIPLDSGCQRTPRYIR